MTTTHPDKITMTKRHLIARFSPHGAHSLIKASERWCGRGAPSQQDSDACSAYEINNRRIQSGCRSSAVAHEYYLQVHVNGAE